MPEPVPDKNGAMNTFNHEHIKVYKVVTPLVVLVDKAEKDISQRRSYLPARCKEPRDRIRARAWARARARNDGMLQLEGMHKARAK